MRVFTTLPQENLQKVGPAAQAIEATGYTGVSTQENRHDPFLALAVAGEFPLALQVPSNFMGLVGRKGAPVTWVPLEPALAVFSVASITAKAPHPNAAKLLIEYLISLEAQTIIAAADEVPIHPGIEIKDAAVRPDPEKFKLNFMTPEMLEASLPAWAKIYDELFK